MKQTAIFLIAIAFSAGALTQALPESPQSAETPQSVSASSEARVAGQSMWDRMERLPRGQKIKIQFGNGRWGHCMFAGVSDAYLYCASEYDSGFVEEGQINRANIADFKPDHDVRNGHIAFAAGVISVGLAFGLQPRDESASVLVGMLGGLVGTNPGSIASCAVGHCITLSPNLFELRPSYGFRVNVPLRSARRSRR